VAPFRSLLGSNVTASPEEISAVRAAAHFASTLPAKTKLIYVVDVSGSNPAFEASRFENVSRMALPASRMNDVRLFLGTPAGLAAGTPLVTGDPVEDGLARLYAKAASAALRGPHAVFLLRPFDTHEFDAVHAGRLVAPDVRVLAWPIRHGTAAALPALGRVTPIARLFLSIAFLLLLALAGFGWIRALMPALAPVLQTSLAPAVGAGALVLGLVAADAIGLRLDRSAVWVCPLVAASGLLAWWRSASAKPQASGPTIFSARTVSSYSDSLR
jgi:hypothetical protein